MAGTVPDGLADTFAASRRAMDDMPMDDTDYGTVTWNVDRVRAAAKAVEQRGDHLHTVVAADARGHSLGQWMKAESIRHAHRRYPDLGGLLTDTADSNTHMRQINDRLGYTPTHTTHQYQLDL